VLKAGVMAVLQSEYREILYLLKPAEVETGAALLLVLS